MDLSNEFDLTQKKTAGPLITHLCYADDVFIFTSAHQPGINSLRGFLIKYQEGTGQLINPNKSSIIFSNHIAPSKVKDILQLTGFNPSHLPIKYLGVPLHKGKRKIILFDEILSKIKTKIQGWERHTLSAGGRLTLIKSVLTSMPLYLLQVIQAPKTVLKHLNKLFARFFWGTAEAQQQIHWAKWNKVCYPVMEEVLV